VNLSPVGNAPQRLGRYEILRPLARGGMAELFLARATGIQGFEKLVVVKRILPELQGDAELLRMFLDEARLAANLHHSNIAQVYDIGEDGGAPFFSMEYLHGEDLRTVAAASWKTGDRLPLEHTLSIIIGVCAGLHYAHEKRDSDGRPLGIVHRDVSPPNVIVTWEGGIKVVDFGVAKARRRLTETRHGTLKGKLTYMSPEQCLGEEVDRRSDVYAISILLWELVTGRRLFGGKSDFSIMKSIIERDAPSPSLVWKDCPPELDAIVCQGLKRHRESRYQTAEDLQLALEDFAREGRLALSPVGLARCMKELFDGRVKAIEEAEREGGEALVSLVASTIEARTLFPDEDAESKATIYDGEISVTPLPVHFTRAVALARRPRRRHLLLAAAAGVVVATALTVGGVALRLRRLAVHELPAPAANSVRPSGSTQAGAAPSSSAARGAAASGGAAPNGAAPGTQAAGSAAAGPTTAAANDSSSGASDDEPAAKPASDDGTAAQEPAPRGAKSHAVAAPAGPPARLHKHARPHERKKGAGSSGAAAQPADVDLDAPLPPK
jgi:serine/threonine-protein kinase